MIGSGAQARGIRALDLRPGAGVFRKWSSRPCVSRRCGRERANSKSSRSMLGRSLPKRLPRRGPRSNKAGLELRQAVGTRPAAGAGRSTKLSRHSLENLVGNAVKYGAAGCWLEVEAVNVGVNGSREVQNPGPRPRNRHPAPGNQEHLPSLLSRRRRLRGADRGFRPGTEAGPRHDPRHGRRFDGRERTRPGQHFYDPLAARRTRRKPTMSYEKILLVEDEIGIRVTLADRLRSDGYEVETAEGRANRGLGVGAARRIRPVSLRHQ